MIKNRQKIFLSLFIIFSLILWISNVNANANVEATLTSEGSWWSATSITKDMYYPQPQVWVVTYEAMDKNLIENQLKKENNVLIKLSCDSKKILSKIGINYWTWIELNNVSFSKDGLLYNMDLKNCNLNWSREIYNQVNDKITEEIAKEKLKEFINTTFLKDFYKLDINKFVISTKDNNYMHPMVMDVRKENSSWLWVSWFSNENDIIIEDWNNNEDEFIDNKYNSITYIQPLILNWKDVYNQYWEKLWLTITIDSNWANYINLSLIQVKWTLKKANLINVDEVLELIKSWANNPYYSEKDINIKMNDIKEVYVQSFYWNNNKNESYLSNWYKIVSKDTKNTQYWVSNLLDQNYFQIINKVKFLNTKFQY